MNDEEIAVRLAEHGKEIGSLKHRMKDQEDQNKTIQDLVISVKELALNMRTMMEEQKEQGERLEKLESEPGEKWKLVVRTGITVIVSALAGGVAGTIFGTFL